ncbi:MULTISPECIES: thiol-disulfide oxidoreductase DCC family protein [unclassified Nonomuraea]|uniref:thiol-disulfide oxidoreductase DCC family protein n=1 Tax=Nonomuraea sp. NPDC003804 TaxID=3154547 RepID=UPI0033A45495
MRSLLVFDGDCAFCTTCVRFVERLLPTKAEIIPWQFADLRALGVSQARAEYELLWVDERGAVFGGAQAVAKLLIDAGLPWSPLGLLLRVPPVRWLAHGLYRAVANNRHRLPGGSPACALPADRRPLQR